MTATTLEADNITVRACGVTDVGRVRKNNEDTLLIAHLSSVAKTAPPAHAVTFEAAYPVLLAVSDGMGGAAAGEIASALVVESLRRAMATARGNWDDATRVAVERANREVWQASHQPGRHGMGATLTAVCVHGPEAHIAEVGDSRAYLIRSGHIRQITHDQSFVQVLLDAGMIQPEDAEQHPMRSMLLQAMGLDPDVKASVARLELRRNDRLLLCSDGLSNKLSADDMLAVIEQGPSLEAACERLIALANQRGGEDNITAIVAELNGEGLMPPMRGEKVTQTLHTVTEFEPPKKL
ncbi:protein phosphatase [Sorangium cellulosum]|uniref:Protein phosphatase n=1 Tax=Sorangium cellulosum TaxID=56 RepID=A0A2L0ER97_SORCE|nr:PP2C family serine/threonine-protein phosphatase [Sorangium cellulosum]AUX41837.1 protein phosphatase [Sorangium cellulosum]